jgi:RNA polymerase sigma-70 factor (sigma-E family)
MAAMAEAEATVSEHAGSFEGFFEEHYERLLRVLYLSTGDRHEAEDLAQDAFVRVFERWGRVQGMERPDGYLYRTALNLRRSRLRRLAVVTRKLFTQVSEEGADPAVGSSERDAIRRALAALPDGQRGAVLLVEWLGMTDAEAGEVLGVSPGAVRVRLSRARLVLREKLRGANDE